MSSRVASSIQQQLLLLLKACFSRRRRRVPSCRLSQPSLSTLTLSLPLFPYHLSHVQSALHDAADAGDAETLCSLLAKAAAGTADADFDPSAARANADDGPDLDERDDEGCTPLHVALLRGEYRGDLDFSC